MTQRVLRELYGGGCRCREVGDQCFGVAVGRRRLEPDSSAAVVRADEIEGQRFGADATGLDGGHRLRMCDDDGAQRLVAGDLALAQQILLQLDGFGGEPWAMPPMLVFASGERRLKWQPAALVEGFADRLVLQGQQDAALVLDLQFPEQRFAEERQ